MHALWADAGLNEIKHPSDEQVIDLMTKRFMAMIDDNPELLKTLLIKKRGEH